MDPGIARDWSELSIASVEVESDTPFGGAGLFENKPDWPASYAHE